LKSYLYWVDQALWMANALFLWVVLVVSAARRTRGSLPRFFIFLTFVAVETGLLLAIGQLLPYSIYFWSFYIGQAGETALLVIALYEVFYKTFAPLESLPPKTMARLCTFVATAAIVTLTWGIWNPASHHNFPWYVDLLSTANRSSGIVVACSLWTVVMYARAIGIPWRSRIAEVARGFLVYLSIQAVTTTVTGYAGQASTLWCNRVAMLAYLVALGIWLQAVLQKEIPVILPAPHALTSLRGAVARLRMQAVSLRVIARSRLREE
jgi:hypothetical protein